MDKIGDLVFEEADPDKVLFKKEIVGAKFEDGYLNIKFGKNS